MKQHILPKQMAEITEDQCDNLLKNKIGRAIDYMHTHHKKFTIGKMIDIIQEDRNYWHIDIEYRGKQNDWYVSFYDMNEQTLDVVGECLCDCLWFTLLKVKGLVEE